jgi:TPR repeat protein
MRATGRGIRQDLADAATWLRRAAESGNALALCVLGAMLIEGEGVDQDVPEGEKNLREAADKGYGQAQFQWALRLENAGDKAAAKYFKMAAEQGCKEAQDAVARVLHEDL